MERITLKRIVCTVTNDLTYDQRMARICSSLSAVYDVTLIGRLRSNSKPLLEKPYHQKRFRNWFNRKFVFYIEHNVRLFFLLLKEPCDAICSIDLDTILAGYFASRIKGIPLVYDAHEYFTEMEEVVRRPHVHTIWKWIARFTIPKIQAGYTVSLGYAQKFKGEYGVDLKLVRNATRLTNSSVLPYESRNYILYQGAVNEGRGLESLLLAMKRIPNKLMICGDGDVYQKLKKLAKEEHLTDKVTFTGYIPPNELKLYTERALIGITLFTNDGLSNQLSLANRFFDYMHSGVPQLVMAYPEYTAVLEKYKLGEAIEKVDKERIYNGLKTLLASRDNWESCKIAALKAREVLNWQHEERVLLDVYKSLFDSK